ncbi:protein transport protein Sec24D-like [Pteropus medius]|uniref:protein transport protein Sec24D-like n=1 Tax=Pteropus vampyrus TaxID=132908 RepID=UPI00196B6BA6|nr:protein transport protein Sec24D-like [Pteropus giganteus]
MPRLGPRPQEAFPTPALCLARGPPASPPHTDSRRVGLTGSCARVLPPPAPPEWAPLPAPRSLCSCGACGPESAYREPGPAERSPAASVLTLSTTPGGGDLALHPAWEGIGGSEARELAWVTHLTNPGGGLPWSAMLPAPPVTSSPCRFLRKAAPKQRSLAHPDSVRSPPPRLLRVRPPPITVGTQPARRLDAGSPGWEQTQVLSHALGLGSEKGDRDPRPGSRQA